MRNFIANMVPRKVSRGNDVKAEDYNVLVDAIGQLRTEIQAVQLKSSADIGVKTNSGGTTAWVKRRGGGGLGGDENRFKFKGLSKNDSGDWFVNIGVGCVLYNEIVNQGVFSSDGKAKIVTTAFPYIDMDGELVRIDDDSKPAVALGDQTDGSIWLACKTQKCGSSSIGSGEKIILTARGEKPEGASDNTTYIPIVDFDVESKGTGANLTKSATNVYAFLQSDWEQPYQCEDGDDSDSSDQSMTSEWPFSDSIGESGTSGSSHHHSSGDSSGESGESGESGGSGGVSDSSGSGGGGGGGGADCQAQMTAVWTNRVDCMPVDTSVYEASYCIPKKFTFEVDCKFWFKGKFGGVQCQGYAYGVKMDGGKTVGNAAGATADEYRWQNDTQRTLKFEVQNPPACGYVWLEWRFKTFPAVLGFGGVTPDKQGCCGQTYTKRVKLQMATSTGPVAERKLPRVCGECICGSSSSSSSSDSSDSSGS